MKKIIELRIELNDFPTCPDAEAIAEQIRDDFNEVFEVVAEVTVLKDEEREE